MSGLYPSKRNPLVHTNQDLIASKTAESNALAAATTANWLSALSWRWAINELARNPTQRRQYSAIAEFDLELSCDAATTLTSPQLFGVRQTPQVLADDDVNGVDTTDDELDITGHAYLTGDGPVQLTTTGTLPGGTALNTNYWIRSRSANAISLFPTLADAIADTNEINLTSAGSGTHTVVDVQGSANADDDSQRLHFFLYGSLNDGTTITLAAQTAYVERVKHCPLTLYYVVVASTSATETVVMRACPVQPTEW
jgi:hypothetical protein